MASSTVQAVRAADFIDSIGVNTHIDFTWTSYGNLQTVINSIKYLGITNLRDSANNPNDLGANGWWQQVADATGAKFDAFIGSGSQADMTQGLSYMKGLLSQNIVSYIEGGNEEDNAYATSKGNSAALAAQFQQQVYALGHSAGIPVINISFGAGWDKNQTSGNYGTVGNLAPYTDFANGHVYFGTGNPPSYNIDLVNSASHLAASGKPTILTEMGWYTIGNPQDPNSVSETVQAKYMLDGLLDAYKAGDVKTYLYELLDQKTGDGYSENNFGLFHSDGSAKLAAVALHNMTTLLADNGSLNHSFAAGQLNYDLTGLQSTDKSMLMEKSDGSYWLAVWNETRLSSATQSADLSVANHTITLTLGSQADSITIFDPLTGTTAVQSVQGASSVQISLPDHPILVEINPGSGTPVVSKPTPGGSDSSAGGTDSGSVTPPPVVVPPVVSTPDPTPPVVATPEPTPPANGSDLSLNLPLNATVHVGQAVKVPVSISEPSNPGGMMSLNLTVGSGTLSMKDASGHDIAGSGTGEIHYNGTMAQLNAALSTLEYHAGSLDGKAVIGVDVWDQFGVELTKTIDVTLSSPYDPKALSIVSPDKLALHTSASLFDTGIAIHDDWAAHHPGVMSLNLRVTSGTLSMYDTNGKLVDGSGTNAIHVSGTLDQINAELATLRYDSGATAGKGIMTVNIWNQAGVSVTDHIGITTSATKTITAGANDDVIMASKGAGLKGGTGADTFVFTPATTGLKGDHIIDFQLAQGDKIDLHGFGLSASDFAGTGPLTGAHSFNYNNTLVDATTKQPYTLINIDTNGDHVADHSIRLDNVHIDLHQHDFTLA